MKYDKFSEISKAEYFNKEIVIKCIVVGKSISPYYVPYKVLVKCLTERCSCTYKEFTELTIAATNPRILSFIDVSEGRVQTILQQVLKLPCKKFVYSKKEVYTVERIFIGQIMGEDKASHDVQTAYFVGHGLEANTAYVMKGYTTADPFTQQVTHVFTGCEHIESSIETFSLKETYSHLQEFQVANPTADKILIKLDELYDTYARNITKIYGRFDLHLAIDLVFHSVLYFRLKEDAIQKGWIDAMVIGDPTVGKGFIASSLVDYYGVGEIVSGEACSFAGLVAGLQQFNKQHYVVTWGKIPLNDTGLLIVDEAALNPEMWSHLSRTRSEGKAEITKIRTAKTDARTRLMFLCNPINMTISNHSYGIESLLDIIKTPEDIRRFDYVLVVAHNEVKIEEINKEVKQTSFKHPKYLEQQLILWAWSRKVNDVVFSDIAIEKIYSSAIVFGKTYDFSLPLIQGENIRIKIARIAIAFAARVFSNKDKGRVLYVDAVHVECACTFLNMIYQKPVSGYYQRSQLKKLEEANENWQASVDKYIKTFAKTERIYKYFLTARTITSNDIMECLGVPKPIANEIISKLIYHNCLQKKHGYYIKSMAFTEYLKSKVFT